MSAKNTLATFAGAATRPEKVFRAGFRSTATTEAGISTAVVPSPNPSDITADGLDSNGAAAHRIPWTASQTALEAAGEFSWYMDSVFNTAGYTPAATRYIAGVAIWWLEWRTNSTFRWNFSAGSNPNDMSVTQHGKTGKYPVRWTWTNFDDVTMWVDDLPFVTHTALAAWTTAFSANGSFGSLTTLTADYDGNRIADCFVLSDYPRFTDQKSILFLGDSLTCQGGIPSYIYANTAGNSAPDWVTSNGLTSGNGFQSDGTTDFGNVNYLDAGLVPTVIRKLFKAGIETTGNRNYAQSGGDASHAITQHTAAITGGYVPDVALILLGANTIANARTVATEETDYKTLLTAIYNNGTPSVIVATPPSLRADPTYQTTDYDTKTLDYVAMVKSLRAWGIAQGYGSDFITVSDVFSALGGLSIDTGDFQTTNLHPNGSGQYKIGNRIGTDVSRILSSSSSTSRDIIGSTGSGIIGYRRA